jgi:adenylate cyclase
MPLPRTIDTRTFELLQPPSGGALTPEQLVQLQLATADPEGKQAAILIVDDSDELRALNILKLQQFGYTNITAAADGESALAILRREEFDLMILDIEMPRLDGYGVLATLKKDPKLRHLPVLVSSGVDQLDAVVRCIELGAEDFLSKPLKSVIFRARVAASLERKRLRDLERLRLIQVQYEHQLLEVEQEKSERLLLNVLPQTIATRLKQGERTIAERYADVTVLFADVVDFVGLASRTEPEELVALLNDLFSRFDQLAARHGLEKIKTIGDSYLVVGGLPERRTDHAEAVASMALEMLDALAMFNADRGSRLRMRIGLNSGPVVAGIIGRNKFSYDLWGATVNLASRMQSSGLPDCIQVSAATRELLDGKFVLTARGTVACKGLGEVSTFFLQGRVAARAHVLASNSELTAQRTETHVPAAALRPLVP